MVISVFPRDAVLRSTDADWTRCDWEALPDDGKRYEIIDGVLYASTAPSLFHQWISKRGVRLLEEQLEDPGIAFIFAAPVGLFIPGCDPVQPDIVAVLQAHLRCPGADCGDSSTIESRTGFAGQARRLRPRGVTGILGLSPGGTRCAGP